MIEQSLNKRGIKKARRVSIMAAALSVFMVSGCLHEYLAYVNMGYTEYKQLFRGQEIYFITMHGIAVMMEKLIAKACQGQARIKKFFGK